MEHAIEPSRVVSLARRRSPPRWAVFAVQCCVVGVLLLPVSTLLWVALDRPTEGVDGGLVVFTVSVGLALALVACASVLIHVFPPVRDREGRRRAHHT